jgi:hypothetical protein
MYRVNFCASSLISVSMARAVTLFMDEEVVKKGKEIGLNLSKVCENALKEKIELLEAPKGDTGTGNSESKYNESGWWAGPDLDRRPPRCERGVPPS